MTLRIAILVSGEGTTLTRLVDGWDARGARPAEIVLVVADRPGIGAIDRARERHLRVELLPRRPAGEREAWATDLSTLLRAARVDLAVLAGFLSILPPKWVEEWRGRAINLHPSLLPRYGGRGMHGRRVHEAVLAAHETETGVTVHLVTGDVDGGPPLEVRRLPIAPDETPETLRARLAPLEVDALDRTIRRFASGELPLPYR